MQAKFIPILVRLNVEPRSIKRIFDELSHHFEGNFYEQVRSYLKSSDLYGAFSVVNRYLSSVDKYLILMFDEFQELPRLATSEGFFQNLEESYTFEFFRGLTEDFRINLVIAGSLIGPIMDAIDIWHGRFKIFRLREFPREDSIFMLRKLFELSNFKVLDDTLEYIAMAMNDHPFHMQLFGYNLVNMRRADDDTIEKVRKEVQKELVDYYQAKLMEARQIDERTVDLIFRALRGLDINMLNNDEFQVALKLERAGYYE